MIVGPYTPQPAHSVASVRVAGVGRKIPGQVVECASFVAGPTGCLTLAQLGASVIRIDPIGGGSGYRRWPVAGGGHGSRDAESYYRELVTALITAPGPGRGVLVDNAVGRSWMAHDVLVSGRPCTRRGHPDGRPAVDYTVNAEVGTAQITGPEGGGVPVNHVLPAWDLVCGLSVSTAVLAGLRYRDRTSEGSFARIALADIALAGVANLGWLSEAQDGEERPRHGNHVYGSFGVAFSSSGAFGARRAELRPPAGLRPGRVCCT